jgi:hypothetical protein
MRTRLASRPDAYADGLTLEDDDQALDPLRQASFIRPDAIDWQEIDRRSRVFFAAHPIQRMPGDLEKLSHDGAVLLGFVPCKSPRSPTATSPPATPANPAPQATANSTPAPAPSCPPGADGSSNAPAPPATEPSSAEADSLDLKAVKAHCDKLLQALENPQDPLERMLVAHLSVIHCVGLRRWWPALVDSGHRPV